MTVITARPSVVIGPRSERPLDGADAPSLNGMLPGRPTLDGTSRAYVHLHVGQAVWARNGARWRHGWVVSGEAKKAAPALNNGQRTTTVEVEYVADRRGTVFVHRFAVSELRLRDAEPEEFYATLHAGPFEAKP